MQLNNQELISVVGGATSGTLINAFARLLDLVIEVGRMIGASIRKLVK